MVLPREPRCSQSTLQRSGIERAVHVELTAEQANVQPRDSKRDCSMRLKEEK